MTDTTQEEPDALTKEVFMVFNKQTGNREGAYSRAYHTEYEFSSESSAAHAHCWHNFGDPEQFEIRKYRVTYERVFP